MGSKTKCNGATVLLLTVSPIASSPMPRPTWDAMPLRPDLVAITDIIELIVCSLGPLGFAGQLTSALRTKSTASVDSLSCNSLATEVAVLNPVAANRHFEWRSP